MEIDGTTKWCNTNAYDSKNVIVQCREVNNSTREKVANLTVKMGSLYKTIRVVQEARPEYLEVGAKSLSFPAKGTEDKISVESNANWKVSSAPSWCKIESNQIILFVLLYLLMIVFWSVQMIL